MAADEKFVIEIDYIENGFDAVIKHGKQVQKLGTNNKRFSQFQQGGITAQNRNEALARAKAAKATERAAAVSSKAASKQAAVTAKTVPLAAAANRFGAGGISSLAGNLPQTPTPPFQVPPAHKLTGGGAALPKSPPQFSVLNNPAGNWNAQGKTARTPVPTRMQKMNDILKKTNMSLFKMQMASLGVYFSFMSIGMALTGLFTGLQNIGGTFKSMALGKAFGGVDVAAAMGVDPAALVQGWKNITGIMGMMQTAMAALAAAALTPEVMTAIQSMFLALGVALSDGKVAKALGDIIIAFTQMVTDCILPMLPYLAGLISALGDAGLLKYIILLVLGAQYLLAGLSMLGFAMQGITLITTAVTAAMAAGAVACALWVLAIAGVMVIIDFFINLLANFQQTGWSVTTIINTLIDTFRDLFNTISSIINGISGLLGMGNVVGQYSNIGKDANGNKQIQYNYNFNGNYDDPSAMIKKTQKAQSTAY
jgi:hypothetical protein